MLAAAQEIEKLLMLYGAGQLSVEQVREAVANSARYNPFELIDSALRGPRAASRCLRILHGLEGEGVQPPQVLVPLVMELRSLHAIAQQVHRGVPAQRAMQRVWTQRKPLVQRALQRLNSESLGDMLRHAALIDRISKGAAPGYDPWLEIQRLVLSLAGAPVPLNTEEVFV